MSFKDTTAALHVSKEAEWEYNSWVYNADVAISISSAFAIPKKKMPLFTLLTEV